MKKILTIAVAMLLTASMAAFGADTPAITFRTNLYDLAGEANTFSFGIGATEPTTIEVDCGQGRVAYNVAVMEVSGGAIQATRIRCTVGPEATVRIYADPAKIDYFDGEGAYISAIDFGQCSNLEILNLNHNQLEALDLSQYAKLSYVQLSDNPFTAETPLVMGPHHPDLAMLELAMVEHLEPGFNIGNYPELRSFVAYSTPDLHNVNAATCPKLLQLSIDSTPVASLDVTNNHNLLILNIAETLISSIDLSQCPLLTEFYATKTATDNPAAKLTAIDVSHNPELQRFAANSNLLTDIDVSHNTKLIYLSLTNNLLTGIDVDGLENLSELDIDRNNMSFATLPMPGYETYYYQQNPVRLARSYKRGDVIDLRDKVLREGTVTTAKLFAYSESSDTSRELDDTFYSYADGRITLKRAYAADSLYATFYNDTFSEWPMTTSKFKVKSEADFGKPHAAVTFSTLTDVGGTFRMGVSIDGATEATPKTYYVDCGGQQTEYTTTTSEQPVDAEFTKTSQGYISILVPEGETLTGLSLDGFYVSSIDVSTAPELRYLAVTDAELYDIDLGMNRCLRQLDLSGNQLSKVDFSAPNGSYGKNALADIDLSRNRIAELTISEVRCIRKLDLSDNQIADFKFKDFDNVEQVRINNNRLSSLDLSYMTSASVVEAAGNMLNEIILPETNVFSRLDISRNRFTMATLPIVRSGAAEFSYIYAPQAPYSIPNKGPGIDLTPLYTASDGTSHTEYSLYTADGTALSEGTDYTCTRGRIAFLDPVVGKSVYAGMTNPAFPDFGGDNILRTTEILAAAFPTNCIAEFTTLYDGQNVGLSLAAWDREGTALYIDWAGEGKDLAQYILTDTYIRFTATTTAGAHVKAYTYSPEERIKVFSVNGASMADFDGSRLTDLKALTLDACGLNENNAVLPVSDNLQELSLNNNTFTTFEPATFPGLTSLNLTANQLTSFDMTDAPNMEWLNLSHNRITDVTLLGSKIVQIDLSDNRLETVDLSGVPQLPQLALSGNLLSTLDVSGLDRLIMLLLDRNRFTFSTLPPVRNSFARYVYGNQAAVEAECVDGRVDLSDQAVVDGVATEYSWWVDAPEVDEDGNLVGEELYAGDEYTCTDGVTSFHIALNHVQGVMTNAAFPSLVLRTTFIDTTRDPAGIDDIEGETDAPAEYYDLHGVRVADPAPGLYIRRRGSVTEKVVVR